jgi:hypothetical protein
MTTTQQSPKNKAAGTLDFKDVVQISNTIKLVTSWKREIKSKQKQVTE